MLSPTRMKFFGTTEVNRVIQGRFKRGLIERAKAGYPKPFGDQQIVYTDKVVQIKNCRGRIWRSGRAEKGYVANGEVGLVTNTKRIETRGKKHDLLNVEFSTQLGAPYTYYKGEVSARIPPWLGEERTVVQE